MDEEQKRARISAVYNIFAYVMLIVFLMILPRLNDSLHPGNGGNPGFNKYDLDSTMRMVFYPAVIGWILLGVWMMTIKVRIEKLKRKTFINACRDMDIRYERLADLEYDDFKAGTWPNRTAWLEAYERHIKSGPAHGLEAIRQWQQQGLRVALMDEHPKLDGPKQCAARVLTLDQGADQGGVIYLKVKLDQQNHRAVLAGPENPSCSTP